MVKFGKFLAEPDRLTIAGRPEPFVTLLPSEHRSYSPLTATSHATPRAGWSLR